MGIKETWKKTLSVDFDGTICEHQFPGIGPLMPGVREALTELRTKFSIVISSCRTSKQFGEFQDRDKYVKDMIEYLDAHDVPYDRIDMGDEGKVVAWRYVDDHAVEFKNNWGDIVERLMK